MSTIGESYARDLAKMTSVLKLWKKEGKTATVQFNFPNTVAVAAGISDAIEAHFVTVDDAGRELIKQFTAVCANEPTVLMVRAVITLEGT